MFDKLEEVVARYEELNQMLVSPEVLADSKKMIECNKAINEITEIVEKYKEYKKYVDDIEFIKESFKTEKDPDMKEMLNEELKEAEEKLPSLEEELKILLLPKDKNDDKNVIVEIRGGAGGDEAALFAADLFRMYSRYAERKKWKIEIIEKQDGELNGLKEVAFTIIGLGAYSRLKFESGVHRVQRVPKTEASGRIHTSTATVAVLPEVEDVQEVTVDPKDLKIDTYRSGGAGGQHVNMTDSAVRITHLPTGIVVTCQNERDQRQNKEKALQILRSRLYLEALQKEVEKTAADRKGQVGSGDRSERIRTYNFPQGRVTDHRVHVTLYQLDDFLNGHMEPILHRLIEADLAQRMGDEDA